ncbi:MAG: Sapep family Mn(2+)-dependent dipeptidase [Bacilli bacterium]|nr:Sapep family Mn(2+)-dependent dipeptidase [Bacilli bacterium]
MANFKKLAKNYEHIGLLALQELVRKNSVYDATTIAPDAPYGAGVKSALDFVAKLGEDYGFQVDRCNGYATEISFGEGEGPLIGIYAHSDVVPVSGKWDHPPFGADIVGEGKNAKMIGRGTSDDKGPLIAALMALKLLKDNGMIQGYLVRLVTGGDEERGSSCLNYYFHELKKPDSDYGFTPDADFPLIFAEKGITHASASKKMNLSPILAIDGGVVSNAVCDKVVITLPKDAKLKAALAKDVPGSSYDEAGEIAIVTFRGKSAHGSMPQNGENAALKAFAYLGDFYHINELARLALTLSDPNGRGFGGYSESPNFGVAKDSTYNYGIVKYGSDGVLHLSIDFRYGEAGNPEKNLAAFSEKTGFAVKVDSQLPVLFFDKKSPLVSTLMKSYRHMTHRFFDKPMAIGGGTYAKEAKNCVAYGSAFPGHRGDIHSPNEYIYLSDFYAQIAIYADAIHALGKLKK